MNQPEPEDLRLLRIHKKWADGMTIIWLVIVVGLFVGVYAIMDQMRVATAERGLVLLVLMAAVPTVAIWQAVSLGVYRVHLIIRGIDLSPPQRARGPWSR
jgi:hypothetical protein